MRRFYWYFLILILACTVVGCSDGEDEPSPNNNFLLAEPSVRKYKVGDTFKPSDDGLEVFTSSEGKDEPVPVMLDQVTITLLEPPYASENLNEVSLKTGYTLKTLGTNVVFLEYEGLKTNYSIDVSEKANGPDIFITWGDEK